MDREHRPTIRLGNYQGPGVYRHYKGGYYRVLGIAWREETKKKTTNSGSASAWREVIYAPLTPGGALDDVEDVDFWSRLLGNFNEKVIIKDERLEGVEVPRFEFLFP